jgi:hypothetical protein
VPLLNEPRRVGVERSRIERLDAPLSAPALRARVDAAGRVSVHWVESNSLKKTGD